LHWGSPGAGPPAAKSSSSLDEKKRDVFWKSAMSSSCSLGRLDAVLRVVGDRAARLLDEVGGAPVVHEHRVEGRRVDGARDAAPQGDRVAVDRRGAARAPAAAR
jgi:hypothetical protein